MIDSLPPDGALPLYTIYDNPKDAPGKFVVRRWTIDCRGEVVADFHAGIFNSLDEARAALPPGLYNLGRQPDDDSAICEVWI